ncbi:MAG: hypothetical protein JW863_21670 [Chitinispirillaceae bacterium]|nr:hypothetical protein [Chitinispirillaceae bacterium]
MKSVAVTITVFIALLSCICFIFSSYQSARMHGKGQKTVTPSVGAAVVTDFGRRNTIVTPVGVSIGIGKSERLNFQVTEGIYGTFGKDDEGVPINYGFNYGGVDVKLG